MNIYRILFYFKKERKEEIYLPKTIIQIVHIINSNSLVDSLSASRAIITF